MAFGELLYRRHRKRVKLVHGVPIACKKYGLKHNNNPAEQMVDELKDWYKHMNGLSSDKSAADLVRGWFVYENFVDTHGHAKTWAERAGLDLRLPREDWIQVMIKGAARWAIKNRKKFHQPLT